MRDWWCAVVLLGMMAGWARGENRNAAVEANERLAGRVYAGVREPGKNVVVGVAGVSAAMGLTVAGAGGETRDEMLRVLGWGREAGDEKAWRAWLGSMGENDGTWGPVRLRVGMWARDAAGLKEGFATIARRTFGADVRPMTGDATLVARQINDWLGPRAAADRVVEARGVGSGDVVVASSAEAKLDWLARFDPQATRVEPFHVTATRTARAKMMHATVAECLYVEGEHWRTLVLPLWGRAVSFGVALPEEGVGVERVEKELVSGGVRALMKGERVREAVDVALPRFAVAGRYNLADVFRRMGVRKALQPGGADFRGIDDSGLWLGTTITHLARISVDEGGMDARVQLAGDDGPTTNRAVQFRVDRPFVLWVTQTDTGATLFIGRVNSPTE